MNVCHTPVVRQCGDSPVGPEICSTHYETNCETRYKTYEVEQDEPVCVMELMKKCNNITRKSITLRTRPSIFRSEWPICTERSDGPGFHLLPRHRRRHVRAARSGQTRPGQILLNFLLWSISAATFFYKCYTSRLSSQCG